MCIILVCMGVLTSTGMPITCGTFAVFAKSHVCASQASGGSAGSGAGGEKKRDGSGSCNEGGGAASDDEGYQPSDPDEDTVWTHLQGPQAWIINTTNLALQRRRVIEWV